MKNVGIQQKLYGLLGICISVMAILSLVGYFGLNTVNESLNMIVDESARKVELAQDINIHVLETVRYEKDLIIARNPADMERFAQQIRRLRGKVIEIEQNLRKLATPEGIRRLDSFLLHFNAWHDNSEQVIDLSMQNTNVEATNLSQQDSRAAYQRVLEVSESLLARLSGERRMQLIEISNMMSLVFTYEKDVILERNSEQMQQLVRNLDRIKQDIGQNFGRFNPTERDLQQFRQELSQAWQQYLQIHSRVLDLALINSNQKAFQLSSGPGRERMDQAEQALQEIVALYQGEMTRDKELSDSRTAFAIWLMVLASIFGTFTSSLLGYRMIKSIVQKISSISTDLSSAAEQLAAASHQVSAASQILSEGANEQASSIDETSSSLEEMSAMTQQNDHNANTVATLMENAIRSINENKQSMDSLAQAINEIKDSSDETFKIVKTIDEIAFQTNLLALNAAVEAARAGDAGRGFAVVADEVGALAQRAGEAARNTSDMIERSVITSKKGVSMAQQTEKSLASVISSTTEVSSLMTEVVASCQEQARGISQINQAIGQLNLVTQQNSSAAEESAASSEELSAQAEQLIGVVSDLKSIIGGKGEKHVTKPKESEHKKGSTTVVHLPSHPVAASKTTNKAKVSVGHKDLERLIPFEKNDDKEVAGF